MLDRLLQSRYKRMCWVTNVNVCKFQVVCCLTNKRKGWKNSDCFFQKIVTFVFEKEKSTYWFILYFVSLFTLATVVNVAFVKF